MAKKKLKKKTTTKGQRLNVRVEDGELKKIKTMARKANLPLSTWVRQASMGL